MTLFENLEAVFEFEIVGHRYLWSGGLKLERALSQLPAIRIVAVEKPLARVYRCLLVLHARRHIDPVGDAVTVSNNEGRTIECFCFEERLKGMLILCPHRDRSDIDVAVGHHHQSQVFLGTTFSARGEL